MLNPHGALDGCVLTLNNTVPAVSWNSKGFVSIPKEVVIILHLPSGTPVAFGRVFIIRTVKPGHCQEKSQCHRYSPAHRARGYK